MLSVIPDIHADPERLHRTLAKVDQSRKLVFLGDLIDAGDEVENPSDRQVLTVARQLIDCGRAVGIMGNHELNAILFHRSGPNGPLRQHIEKNRCQHKSFTDSFGIATPEAIAWTNWFLTALPLWRELHGLRLTHAYWGEEQVRIISARRPDGFLEEKDIWEIAEGSSDFAKAVKLMISGPEVELPPNYSITDNRKHERREMRLAWWRSAPITWKDAALSVSNMDELPSGTLPADLIPSFRTDRPVLFGHYKLAGLPRLENIKAACLDFPAAPCYYAWKGESELTKENLMTV